MPQLLGSLARLVQEPLQLVCPDGQHLPDEHVEPLPHLWPHVPQLLGSLGSATQVPPQ
jgi:hypothetical protein